MILIYWSDTIWQKIGKSVCLGWCVCAFIKSPKVNFSQTLWSESLLLTVNVIDWKTKTSSVNVKSTVMLSIANISSFEMAVRCRERVREYHYYSCRLSSHAFQANVKIIFEFITSGHLSLSPLIQRAIIQLHMYGSVGVCLRVFICMCECFQFCKSDDHIVAP